MTPVAALTTMIAVCTSTAQNSAAQPHILQCPITILLLALAVYFVWSWLDIQREAQAVDLRLRPQMWRLWWGIGLLAFSGLGRFVLPLVLGRGGDHGHREQREGERTMVPGPDGSTLC